MQGQVSWLQQQLAELKGALGGNVPSTYANIGDVSVSEKIA